MKMRTTLAVAIVGLMTVGWGCERKPAPQAEAPSAATEAGAGPAGDPAAVESAGSILGNVTFTGTWKAPTIPVTKDQEVCGTSKQDPSLLLSPQGAVQNAVVYLKDVRGGKSIEPQKVVLDQKDCEYSPHVLAFPAGSTVEILNPDGVLHNVHTLSKVNTPFNMAQPKFKTSMGVTIDKPEIIAVKCDVHPWMSGWFFVAENAYFSLTDADGSFSLADVPPGSYRLEVWHEKLGTQSQPVEVAPDGKIEVNFQFSDPVV